MSPSIPIGNPPVTQAWLGIWYAPRADETDPADLADARKGGWSAWRTVPPDPAADPFGCAASILADAPSQARVYLLVPGTRFDRFGTRRGRGGGWYDRFLSRLPRAWLRIGVATDGRLVDAPLLRQPWDEPMDWLVER